MKNMRTLMLSLVLPLAAGFAGAWLFSRQAGVSGPVLTFGAANSPMQQVNLKEMPAGFVKASRISTPAVVFIKTVSTVEYRSNWF